MSGAERADGFHPAFRGYRMDQVDEVLDALEARVAEHEREIARLRGEPLRQVGVAERLSHLVPAADEDAGPAGAATAAGHAGAEPVANEDDHDPGPGLPPWLVLGWWSAMAPQEPAEPLPRVRRVRDLVVLAAYLLFGLYVTQNLLRSHGAGYLSQGVQDQQAFEWYLAATAHNVTHLHNPLFSDLQNYPAGVNLMANAAVLGLGIPLTPVTLLWGAHSTFFLIEWLGLSLTAAAWYWLFVRRLRVGWAGAAVGAWLCGFAPAMISHANGHPNFVAAFVVPVIIDRLAALRGGGRPARVGAGLGLLVAWQVLIGEEILLLASIALLVLALVLAAHRRLHLRRMLPGLGTGAGVALLLVGLPLWWQFFGPQSYSSLWHPPAGNDLAALWGIATRSRGADPWASAALSMNRTEENAFFGVAPWVLAGAVVVLLLRRPLVRALGAVVLVMTWLSLGESVTLHGEPTGVPALWALVQHLPVLENVLPTRFAMVLGPVFGALLALGIDAAARLGRRERYAAVGVPSVVLSAASTATALVVAAVALRPVLPTPLVVDPRPPMPTFFSDGVWHRYLHGGSLLAAPPPDIADARALEWQIEAGMGFPLAEGYFVGPGPGGEGQYGATRTSLSLWLYDVNAANKPSLASAQQRAQFAEDLRTERVDAIVLPDRDQTPALLASLESAFGVPERAGEVYVWDVREDRLTG